MNRAALSICLSITSIAAAGAAQPLWPGARYTTADRDEAVKRGLQFIYRLSKEPRTFGEWGHDLLWCFYTISATAKNSGIREMARRLGHERALEWRRENPGPPSDDAAELSDFLFGTIAANGLGVPEGAAIRGQIQAAAARYSAEDFLDFDPSREPPPADVPQPCPNSKCGYQNRRGTKKCEKCNSPLTFKNRYDVWLDALISTYTGDVYGVKLGGSYDNVLRWITGMRPYASDEQIGPGESWHIVYAITHVIYTLDDYGRYQLSTAWLPEEFNYLKAHLSQTARQGDVETLGEFMDTLRAFGMSEKDDLIRSAVDYELSHQNADGSWGALSQGPYGRYHSTWTAVDGLREYRFEGQRLRRPELLSLIRSRPTRTAALR